MSTFTPRIDEYWLNIISIGGSGGVTGGFSRNVAVHDIPFSRRNLIQDNGSSTKTYTFTVAFQDAPPIAPGQELENRFLPTFLSHLGFIQLLNSGNSLIFQHPEEGVVDVKVESVSERYTSVVNYVEIDITLYRELDEVAARDVKYPVDENAASFRESTKANESKLQQIAKTLSPIAFQSQVAQYTNKLNSLLSDVNSVSNSIINSINYVEGTIGDTLLAVNQTVDRMVQAQKDLVLSPATFINNLVTQSRSLAANFLDAGGIATTESILTLTMATSRIAVEIAETYVDDDVNGEKLLKNVGIQTFDNKGFYLGTPELIAVMTINELESTVSEFRKLVDDVIQLDRNNRDLLNQARTLQTYVDENKLDREKVITVSVGNEISIYALLNRFRLSYQEADKNLSLNPQIRNPNFMTGDVRLIVPNV